MLSPQICQTWMKHLQETSRSSVWVVTEELLSKLLEYITQVCIG